MHIHKGQIRFELPGDQETGLVVYLEWPMRVRGQTDRLEEGIDLI